MKPFKKLKFYKKDGRFSGFIQEIFYFFPASGQFQCDNMAIALPFLGCAGELCLTSGPFQCDGTAVVPHPQACFAWLSLRSCAHGSVASAHKKTVPWKRDGMLIDKFYASLPYDSEYLID